MGLPEDWEEGRLDVLAVEIEIITVDYRCNKLAVSLSVYRGFQCQSTEGKYNVHGLGIHQMFCLGDEFHYNVSS